MHPPCSSSLWFRSLVTVLSALAALTALSGAPASRPKTPQPPSAGAPAPQPINLQSLRAQNDAALTELLSNFASRPAGDNGRRIFDTYTRDGDVKWARESWPYRIDFTGIGWDDYRYGTAQSQSACEVILVSPRHVLFSGHYGRGNGEHGTGWRIPAAAGKGKAIFHDRSGRRVVRNIIAVSPAAGEPTSYDTVVGLLDKPVPKGVRFYKLLPRDGIGAKSLYPKLLLDAKVVVTTRERECALYKIVSINSNLVSLGIESTIPEASRIPVRDGGAADSVIAGDSGNPLFLFVRGQPIVIGHYWYPGGPGGGPFYSSAAVFDYISAHMASLGGGYRVSTVSF